MSEIFPPNIIVTALFRIGKGPQEERPIVGESAAVCQGLFVRYTERVSPTHRYNFTTDKQAGWAVNSMS